MASPWPVTALTIRSMHAGELPLALDWAAAEGWNPGLGDGESFQAADPDGFLLGLLGEEPIGCISAIRYGSDFGFLGFYLVRPPHRGQGHGLRLWNASLARLQGRSIALDGVLAQQANYRASGFEFSHRNIRHQGPGGAPGEPDGAIVTLSPDRFAEVLAYDAPFFPSGREAFLAAWLRQDGSQALGLLEAGRLAGYGMIRPCRVGYKIGPLFADGPELAERLFLALRGRVPAEGPVILDVPEPNGAAARLALRHGLTPVFETARMVRGAVPPLPLQRLFGVTSFELG